MGLYDVVRCHGDVFRCSEGHDLSEAEFQTKDLGQTMGEWSLGGVGDRLEGTPGEWNSGPRRPFLGRMSVYTNCRKCPAFVQDRTANLVACWVEFEVELVDDFIRSVKLVSPPTAQFLEETPKLPYMANCVGPMTWEEAEARHVGHHRDRLLGGAK